MGNQIGLLKSSQTNPPNKFDQTLEFEKNPYLIGLRTFHHLLLLAAFASSYILPFLFAYEYTKWQMMLVFDFGFISNIFCLLGAEVKIYF